jgi:LysM repeat protein
MKNPNMFKTAVAVILILLSIYPAAGQVLVERSKDKVVISGVTYYIHQVRKGETAYSIAKAYGLSVEELNRENPPALYGIHTGQTLRIPIRLVQEKPVTFTEIASSKHDDARFLYHILKAGETIYFLSKTYGVSENEIISNNPGIDITKLSVGTELAIPRKEFMTSQQKFDDSSKAGNTPTTVKNATREENRPQPEIKQEPQIGQQSKTIEPEKEKPLPPQEKGFFFHKVQNGESLSSIADKYGVTLREIKKANRDLRFPQVGDYVRIPGTQPVEKLETKPVTKDTVHVPVLIPSVNYEKPSEFTAVKDLKGSLNVAVLLPFYLNENSMRSEIDSSKVVKGKKSYKVIPRDDSWIYPMSVDFIEMYEGILLAADTLRALGLDITINTFDIKKDTFALHRLLRDGKLKGMDLIIGPVYSNNLAIVANWAKDENIPVVSPVPLYDNSILNGNPQLFLASSTLDVAQQCLAEKMKEYADQNFVFVHADTLGVDDDVRKFKKMLLTEISTRVPFEDIKFREFPFYSRSMFNNDSINRLEHTLSDRTKNIIIIASEDPPVISETIIDIHSLIKRYDLKVFGYPVLRDLDNLDPKYFFDLDLQIFSPYWIDYSKGDVINFNSRFRQKFLTEPTERSYAWEGYDIAYYFMSGIALHGKEFVEHPSIHHPDLLQTDFDFVNNSPDRGFENRNLYQIHYTKEYEVHLDDEKSHKQ